MHFFDLVNISERFMELVNPTTPEKIIRFGQRLGLQEGHRIIDFGCGYAEPLVIWAEEFGITGLGIDIREYACERAQKKIRGRGLIDRLEIVCADAAKYPFQQKAYDFATCIGASFIWDGYEAAVQAMNGAIVNGGRLGIGEPYWLHDHVPAGYRQQEASVHREIDLFRINQAAGFTIEGIVRSSRDDWDRYESDNWFGLMRWLEENPNHPERAEVLQHLQKTQEDYLRFGRQYLGWAMYVLAPMS